MQIREVLPKFLLGLFALGILLSTGTSSYAACSKRVVMYDASWCPYCRQVRAILKRNNIRYTVRDATTPRVQAEMIKRFGDASVPRTVIGRTVVPGVDEARIKKLCQ